MWVWTESINNKWLLFFFFTIVGRSTLIRLALIVRSSAVIAAGRGGSQGHPARASPSRSLHPSAHSFRHQGEAGRNHGHVENMWNSHMDCNPSLGSNWGTWRCEAAVLPAARRCCWPYTSYTFLATGVVLSMEYILYIMYRSKTRNCFKRSLHLCYHVKDAY